MAGYRHKIVLLMPSGATLVDGVEVTNYVTAAEMFAAIEPLSGRELFQAQAVNPELSHRVKIRYHAGIVSSMRIRYGSRIFEIVSPPIDTGERHRELVLMCKEMIQNGS